MGSEPFSHSGVRAFLSKRGSSLFLKAGFEPFFLKAGFEPFSRSGVRAFFEKWGRSLFGIAGSEPFSIDAQTKHKFWWGPSLLSQLGSIAAVTGPAYK